jgi:hypothetical protein
MGRDLKSKDLTRVYRIFDLVEKMFCSSGRGLYAGNGRSVWTGKGAAEVARRITKGRRTAYREVGRALLSILKGGNDNGSP